MLEKEGNQQYPSMGKTKDLDLKNPDIFNSMLDMLQHYEPELREAAEA